MGQIKNGYNRFQFETEKTHRFGGLLFKEQLCSFYIHIKAKYFHFRENNFLVPPTPQVE